MNDSNGMNLDDSASPVEQQRRQRRAELRNVIAMAVPVVITTSSRAMMDVADYIMITQLHSDEAQAAILPAQLVMWVYIILGMGIVSLVNTFASQSLGRKQYHDCSAYAWQVIYIAALVILTEKIDHLRPLFVAVIELVIR